MSTGKKSKISYFGYVLICCNSLLSIQSQDDGPLAHGGGKDPSESSDSLVKDIMEKAGSMGGMGGGGGKGGPDDGGLGMDKEFQGADISAGPDPYDNDKPNGGNTF